MKLPGKNFRYPHRRFRRKRALLIYGVGLLIWYGLLWAPNPMQSNSLGIQKRVFGIFEYLQLNQVPNHAQTRRHHLYQPDPVEWNSIALSVTIILTLSTTPIVVKLFIDSLSPRQTNRFCDECGYDLKPSRSRICPECGTAIDREEQVD